MTRSGTGRASVGHDVTASRRDEVVDQLLDDRVDDLRQLADRAGGAPALHGPAHPVCAGGSFSMNVARSPASSTGIHWTPRPDR